MITGTWEIRNPSVPEDSPEAIRLHDDGKVELFSNRSWSWYEHSYFPPVPSRAALEERCKQIFGQAVELIPA